ncbi:MAG: hypothetical protein J6P03_08330 [Opitutales bacterium]|nr:hypothetical protein [Opitutales bacterium]
MDLYFSILLGVFLAGMAIASYISDARYVKPYRRRVRENVYHCLKCNSVYTSRAEGDSAACPVCKYRNGRLKF